MAVVHFHWTGLSIHFKNFFTSVRLIPPRFTLDTLRGSAIGEIDFSGLIAG